MDLSKLDSIAFESSDDEDSCSETTSSLPDESISDDLDSMISTASSLMITSNLTKSQKSIEAYIDSIYMPLNKLLVISGLSCTKQTTKVTNLSDSLSAVDKNLQRTISNISSISICNDR
ncbi:hypothetical protein GEMRC1_000869 [Eukaryota sp. GEM-RC1]